MAVSIGLGVGLLVVGAIAAWVLLRRRAANLALWTRFLNDTGYRLPDDTAAPIAQQARRILSRSGLGLAERGPWVRDVGRMWLTYQGRLYLVTEGDQQLVRAQETWSVDLPSAPSFGLQITDRSITNPGGASLRPPPSSHHPPSLPPGEYPPPSLPPPPSMHGWSQVYPYEVRTGDYDFDERFFFCSDQPSIAKYALDDPVLRGQLKRLRAVDLVVQGARAVFQDDAGRNRESIVGHGVVSPRTQLEKEAPLHNRIGAAMSGLAQAMQSPRARSED